MPALFLKDSEGNPMNIVKNGANYLIVKGHEDWHTGYSSPGKFETVRVTQNAIRLEDGAVARPFYQ